MYIFKSSISEENVAFTQIELSDYLGYERKIVFDLDNPSEATKARKILRPKGITRHRTKQTEKNPKLKQKTLSTLFPVKPPSITKKTKSKKFAQKPKKTKEKLHKIKKKSLLIPEISQPEEKSSSETFIREIHEEPLVVIQSGNNQEKNRINSIKIKDQQLGQVGFGGNIEISCPICGDEIFFDYKDLDEKSFSHSRICSCRSLIRISILSQTLKVFSDLKIDPILLKKRSKNLDTSIQDEFGNFIKIHAIQID